VKILRRPLLWMLALALPASLLLLLPLRAQEKSPPPSPPPAQGAETAPAAESPAGGELPPDERVSADNNLSFPVDI